MTSLQSLIATGTKLWLDSIDPDLVARNRALGATGATSNPIIISDLIKTGRFDDALGRFLRHQRDDRARVYAPRKKCSQRNFGHQTNADCFAQQFDGTLARFGLGH